MKISLGILLGSTYLSRRWNPSEIFAASEPGLWVDPSAVANLNWRRNLLTYSEQFDNAAWTKTGATVVANAGVAPDGTMTADSLVPDTANSGHQVNQIAITTATTTTFSVYAKPNGYNWIALGLTDSGSTVRISYFNLATGVVGTIATGITASIVPASNGWYRCVVTVATALAGNNVLRAYAVNSDGNTTFIGNGTSGILIWGAQLEVGSTATSYQQITDLNTEVRTLFPSATLFQDTTGTQPVTTPGQTVALALDRSQGLVLGSELVTNGDFTSATGWTPGTGWTISGGVASANIATGSTLSQAFTTTNGKTYAVTYTITSFTSGSVRARFTGTANVNGVVRSAAGTYTEYLTATATNASFVMVDGGGGFVGSIDNISVKELAGNHLSQATAASRPVYGIEPAGGRRNLLTFTEQFDNAVWTKNASSVTTNSSTAPDGTTTADTITDTVANDVHVAFQSVSVASATTYTFSSYVKAGTLNHAMLRIGGNAFGIPSPSVKATLTGSGSVTVLEGSVTNPTIVAVGGGWYRVSFTSTTVSSVFTAPQVGPHNNGATAIYTGSGTGTVIAWGAQLETGSTATNYQRVTTAFDVTEVGRANMHYLQFDGTDDWMISPTVTPGTDKAQVFAGVRKLSDATDGIVVESSTGSSVGRIQLSAPWDSGVSRYLLRSTGTITAGTSALSTAFNAPATDVLTGIGDIAGDVATLRVDGVQVSTSSSDQGTGNYLAYPLYVGRRGGTTNPFNGRIYQLIVRFGPNLDSEKLNLTELFVGTKTGFYKPIITGIPTWQ